MYKQKIIKYQSNIAELRANDNLNSSTNKKEHIENLN